MRTVETLIKLALQGSKGVYTVYAERRKGVSSIGLACG